METQKLLMYAIIALVGLYFLRETCGLKLPFIDNTEGFLDGIFDGNGNAHATQKMRGKIVILAR